MSSEPIRQPANDLIAFDISKQSPEQIAKLFARWKQQRKQLEASEPRHRAPHLKPVPPIVHGFAGEAEEAAPAPVAGTEPGGAVHYSASFEALLAARAPTLAQRVWNPDAGLAKLGRPHAPRRRSRTKWLLAGAASVIAVTAMAGGVLWERSAGRLGWTQVTDKPAAGNALIAGPAEAAVAPAHPMDIPMAEPFAAKATAARQADWPMRQTVDLALMKTAPVAETADLPLMPQLKPPVPVVQTASKPAAAKPAAAQPQAEPSEAPVAQVALPLVPSVTTATVSVPVAPATDAHNGDSRSNIVTGRGNDKNNFTFGTNGRVASSSSRPAGASGSGGAHGSGSAGGSTGGSGDPGSGGTGGDPGGSTGGSGPGGGDTGGGDTGGGAGGGDTGGGDAGGADPGGGGDAGGGDAGGGDSGGGDSGGGGAGGGGDSGGGDSGGGDSGGSDSGGGGDSGDSDAGGGDTGGGDASGGESGESGGSGGGIGGAIGGAIGGIGDAIGGALGGGKGGPKGDKDKDKDKGKDKDKADWYVVRGSAPAVC